MNNPGSAPPRFIVSAARVPTKWVGISMLAWFAVVVGVMIAINTTLSRDDARTAAGVALVGSVVPYLAFLAYALTPKPIPVELWPAPDRLVVDGGRGGTFPVAGALLGPWMVPTYGTTQGTALHLSDGARHFRLGGRDHRPAPVLRLDAPGIDTVDAFMPAADFDALVACLPAPWAVANRDPMRSPAGVQPVRCSLVPNRASGKAAVAMILPWMITIAACGGVGALLAALGVYDSPAGQAVGTGVVIALAVAGLAVTVVRSMRTPTPALVVEMDARELRVLDLKTGRLLAACPVAGAAASPARHVYRGRTSYTMPVLVLTVPGSKPLTVGIPDYRFSWRGKVNDLGSPAYVVGGADWLALVERLGVRQELVVGPG